MTNLAYIQTNKIQNIRGVFLMYTFRIPILFIEIFVFEEIQFNLILLHIYFHINIKTNISNNNLRNSNSINVYMYLLQVCYLLKRNTCHQNTCKINQ